MSTTSVTAGSAGTSSSASVAILVGRILISALFILAGFAKLTTISATAGWFGSIGLPVPTVTAVVVGLVELLGGLAILVGFQTRLAAHRDRALHHRRNARLLTSTLPTRCRC